MPQVRVHNFSVSLDGFGTGEGQALDAPFGHAGTRLHEWFFATRTFHAMQGQPGGIEEFPLLRETSRSSRAMRSSRSAIFASLSSTGICSRPAGSRSRAFSARSSAASPGTPEFPGASGTPVLHQARPP